MAQAEREILVALNNGPMAGRVLSVGFGTKMVEVPEPNRWGIKFHIYRIHRHEDEIVEGFYEQTRHG